MGNRKAEQTIERISRLNGQERIDAMIALLYSKDRTQLTGDQYMDLALPGVNEMSRLYGAASTNGTFEWPLEPLETRWKCFHLGTCETLDRDRYAPEDIAERLEDSLSEERLEELRNGSPFLDDEWRQVKEEHDFSESESSNSVVAFETNDTLGRSMYFVAEFGDWGTYLGRNGPYIDHEELLAEYTKDEDVMFESVDECWVAFTPNWLPAEHEK